MHVGREGDLDYYMLNLNALFGPSCTSPLVHLALFRIVHWGYQETIWIETRIFYAKV